MPKSALVNFAAGETSPRSRGRFDLPWFGSSAEKLLNFIPEVPGPIRYRPGFKIANQTRGGAVARLIQFQVNDDTSYMLEFTSLKMRVYKNGALLTTARTTVTAITKANPARMTVASGSNLANGDDIIVTGIEGMPELNGRQLRIANLSGVSFDLTDPVTGAGIDSSAFGSYTSGGTLREVYEVTTPYLAADLDNLQWAQNNTQMYIACVSYAPRKLTVDSADTFTLATYSRTADPFATAAASSVDTVSLPTGGNVIVLFAPGTVLNYGSYYALSTFVGSTELNGNTYRIEYVDGFGRPAVNLYRSDGSVVLASEVSGYVSGGTLTPVAETPLSVAFYESRLFFFGTDQRPNTLFGSMTPDASGNTRYDNFTGGTDDDDAVFFALAPVSGQVDYAAWLRGTSKYLFSGTFGGPFRISGSGLDESITPSSINVRQLDLAGCEAVMPAGGSRIFFIKRGGRAVLTMRYNADIDDFETYDMLLNAEHISASRLRRVALQQGRPEILWVVREDGVLAGMTVQGPENVAGWHRHKIGGVDGKVLDIQPLPRTDKDDQLWAVVEVVVAGVTRRFVCYMADDVDFPDFADFYTGGDRVFADAAEDAPGWQEAGFESDVAAWLAALYRRQEEYVHMDAAATYNGADRGVAASATLTPGALTGEGVAFTASAAVFKSTDVGSELWKKPDRDTGLGAGKAIITAYVSTTEVTCEIVSDFDELTAIPAGDWYFAVDTIYSPHHAGALVAVVTDGGVYSDGSGDEDDDYEIVQASAHGGQIDLTDVAAVVHIGFAYEGLYKSHDLAFSGSQTAARNILEMFIRFLGSLGTDYGTNPYAMQQVPRMNLGQDVADRPPPPFTGIAQVANKDFHEKLGKHVYIRQAIPVPCVVQAIEMIYDVTEDG